MADEEFRMFDRVRAWYYGTIVINPLKDLFSEIYTDKGTSASLKRKFWPQLRTMFFLKKYFTRISKGWEQPAKL